MAIIRSTDRPGAIGDVAVDVDLVDALAQRPEQLRRGDHLHVLAHRGAVDRLEVGGRVDLPQLVQHAGLGGDQHGRRRGVAGGVDHAAGRQDLRAGLGHDAGRHEVERARGAPALGVHEQLGVRMLGDPGLQLGAVDAGVDVALAHPDVHVVATGEALHVGAEELVGAEQDVPVGRDRLDDLDGVRRGAADVGLGLHGGRRVDVADHHRARVLGLPGAELIGRDRLGEAAPGAGVGDQHGLVVAQDLRRLGHEVHAAEHDRRRVDLGGDPRQPERVARVVGDVLDLRQLVVVGEDHRVAFGGEPAYLLTPIARQQFDAHLVCHGVQRTIPIGERTTPTGFVHFEVSLYLLSLGKS